MPLVFFPRERLFWLLHISAVMAITAITLLTTAWWGDLSAFNVCASLVWSLPYSGAVLLFRYWYQRGHWHQWPMLQVIALALLYGSVSAVLIVLCVAVLLIPLFTTSVSPVAPDHNMWQLVPNMLISGALQAQLFVCSWIFIYISVSHARRVKDTELHNLRLQNSLKEAQLSQLSNQLNPHFLFNTLNNIRFMMHENTQHADDMVVALSDMLRYSLASSQHDKVTVAQELAMVQGYLSIMKTQMEQRLQFEIAVEPRLQQALMPPMMLQLLAENAIKHGLEQCSSGGVLELTLSTAQGQLCCEVVNDIPATSSGGTHLGIGLDNIRRRLQLLYGERASLHTEQALQRRFVARLQLPLEFAA